MIPFFAEQWNIETAFSFFCLSLCPWRDLFFLELMNNLKCYKGYIVLIEDRKLWKKEKKYRSPKLLLVLYIDYKFLNFGGTLLPSSNKQWNCFWQFRYPKHANLISFYLQESWPIDWRMKGLRLDYIIWVLLWFMIWISSCLLVNRKSHLAEASIGVEI